MESRQQSQSCFLESNLLDFVQGRHKGQDAARQERTDAFIEACSDSTSDAGDQPGRNTSGQGVQAGPLLTQHFCSAPLVRLVYLAAATHCCPLLPSLHCFRIYLGVICAEGCARVSPHPAPGHGNPHFFRLSLMCM